MSDNPNRFAGHEKRSMQAEKIERAKAVREQSKLYEEQSKKIEELVEQIKM